MKVATEEPTAPPPTYTPAPPTPEPTPTTTPPDNVMVLLDASTGMAEGMPGGTRFDVARQSLIDNAGTVPQGVELGVVVYGWNEFPSGNSCRHLQLVYPLGPPDPQLLAKRLAPVGPVGTTTPLFPAIYALDTQFMGSRSGEHNRIIIVGSGPDTCCCPDACAISTGLEGWENTVIDAIGVAADEETRRQFECITGQNGGTYHDAQSAEEMDAALKSLFGR